MNTRPKFTGVFASCLGVLMAAASASEIIISELMYNASGTKAEWIELTNTTTNRLDMANWKLVGGANITLPDFASGTPTAHLFLGRERILLSSKSPAETRVDYPNIPSFVRIYGPWVGSLDNSGEEITLLDKNGAKRTSLEYGDGGRKWPAAADGTGHSLTIINENRAVDDWHNWAASAAQGGTPGTAAVVPSEEPVSDPTASLPLIYTEAVPMTATWRFYKETAAPPTNWNALAFSPDALWGTGPALLGFETAAVPSPGMQTAVQTAGLLSYYFRTTFNWSGGTAGAQFQIDSILDDGATYFINGVYIGNKDALAIVSHNSSVATATVGDATLVTNSVTGTIPPGVLVEGTNVLCAIALQVNTTSSDMVFGSNLRLANTPPTELLINEVKQAGAGSGYIELYNPTGAAIDLNGYFFTDTAGTWTKYPITQSTIVPAGGLATVGFTESGFSATAASTTLYITRPAGTPVSGLVATLPQDGKTVGRKPIGGSSWFRFSIPTPGAANASSASGGGGGSYPVLNEVHFATTGQADWVEVANLTTGPLTLDGLFVSGTKTFADKVALTGSVPVGGYASVNVSFPTNGSGELTLFLLDSGNNVVGEAEVTRRPGKPSSQAWPTGGAEFYATATSTRDAANVPDRNTDVVISEIMYAPPSEHRQGEYIELHNRGAAAVNVGNWRFESGTSFVIPAGTTIPAAGLLVLAQDAAFISANYSGIGAVIGNLGGSLSNSGELLRLVDATGNMADEVDYSTGGDWPRTADGLGSSIELKNPAMNNDSGSAWAASIETQKGQWTNFTYTGTWANTGSGGSATERAEMHFNLVGDGHLVVRNITFGLSTGGQTAMPNSTVLSPLNSGIDGWRVTGTHWASFTDAEGLHIVADGGGDMKGNAIELDVPAFTQTVTPYTINFQARWVGGTNRLIMNTWDRSWGRTFAVPIPNTLGTPGAPNSVATATASPEIWSMLHSPAVPKATDDVKVTARVSSALPLASVNVVHRQDTVAGNTSWTTTAMNDTGTAGDERAGDGIFTANVTAFKTEGTIVQFYIQASATGGGTTTYPAGGASLPGHWIVDSSPVTSDLLVQRFIVAQKDHDSMGQNGYGPTYNYRHPRMSNHYYNATLIVDEKQITYNVESRKSGSPWTRDAGNSMDRIRTKFPKDRMFRGREKTGADNDAADTGPRRWNNRVNRYWLYLLNYPAAEAEFVHVQFNNLGLSLKDDTEPTDTDMLDRTYENSGDTELHEIDDSWYYQDDLSDPGRGNIDGNWLVTVQNIDSAVHWQGSWPIRTQVDRYDFSPLISMIRAAYNNGVTPANGSAADDIFRASIENQLDIDKFARYAAIKGWAGAWDNFTINRGKNGFIYRRPTDGRWEFQFWDGDLDFQYVNAATLEQYPVLGGIGGTAPLFGRPWFRRQLNYYLQEIRDQWSLNSPRMNTWLQAMEDMSPSHSIDQTYYVNWFTNRRATIDGFIGTANQTIALSATASVGASTTLNFTDLTGNAPTSVFNITVDGQPNAVFTWLTQSTWRMKGLYLKEGNNTLTVRAWDRLGASLGNVIVSVSKTGNAPPVLSITGNPNSLNTAIGQTVTVDSVGSFDPEGTNLALTWAVSPTSGVIDTALGLTGRRYVFSTPGIYTVTLTGTDGASNTSTLTRQISAYSAADFNSFGTGVTLPGGLTANNVENRDNDSPAGWYSLEDTTGRLLLQINETAAAPIDSGNFPSITRPLPTTANWLMQTDANLETRHLGDTFNAGLMVDLVENGLPARYIYSWESGDQISVRRSPFYVAPPSIRINAGGPQVTETDSRVWAADTGFLAVPATNVITQAFAPSSGANLLYATVGDTRRVGVASGNIVYEIPVPEWPTFTVALYSASITPSQTISMAVSLNDGAAVNWSANSSSSQIRSLSIAGVVRNSSGKIKISIARNTGTTAGVEAGINGIEIIPTPAGSAGAGLPALPPAPVVADALRVERLGDSLVFSRKVAGEWIVASTKTLPAGTTAVKGGVFASTEKAQNLRASFDYLLIADPAKAAPILAALRLTEVMYNPGGTGVEYLEFQNAGPDALNLSGVTLPATTPFAQFSFGAETLAPGEFIVLTGDPAGFRAKYSVAPRLAVTSWASGGLDNGGERILIQDNVGNAIHDFAYDDVLPWPLAADGQGPSLEVIDMFGDYNDPLNWRASASEDGTPGGTTRLEDPDADGDGIPDWVENAFGLPSNSPGKQPLASTNTSGGIVTIAWPFVAERSYFVEFSTDLETWEELGTVTGMGSLADPSSNSEVRRYYRVTALP